MPSTFSPRALPFSTQTNSRPSSPSSVTIYTATNDDKDAATMPRNPNRAIQGSHYCPEVEADLVLPRREGRCLVLRNINRDVKVRDVETVIREKLASMKADEFLAFHWPPPNVRGRDHRTYCFLVFKSRTVTKVAWDKANKGKGCLLEGLKIRGRGVDILLADRIAHPPQGMKRPVPICTTTQSAVSTTPGNTLIDDSAPAQAVDAAPKAPEQAVTSEADPLFFIDVGRRAALDDSDSGPKPYWW